MQQCGNRQTARLVTAERDVIDVGTEHEEWESQESTLPFWCIFFCVSAVKSSSVVVVVVVNYPTCDFGPNHIFQVCNEC